jgi:alpha-ketoglutarate-dependent 2,4-dichlorophenoxyacetate dioxygenase
MSARRNSLSFDISRAPRAEGIFMTTTVYPVTPSFAAEIGDIDLSGQIARADLLAIKEAFTKYAVLIFPDQHLSQDQHLDFARQFGPLETTIAVYRSDAPLRVRKEFADVSNLNHDNKLWGKESRLRLFQLGNRLWHTDSSFKRLPARASLLYARSIPSVGGHTEFADERAAYEALPEDTKRRLASLVAEHSIFNSRARLGFGNFSDEERREMPPVPQVIVRTIPESGRKSLYLASHAGRILGMPDAEGRALIDQLVAHATQRQFVYTHRWRLHDLVMWDNRCTMHRGTEFDDLRWKRDVQRATVSDVANSCEQEGIEIAAA